MPNNIAGRRTLPFVAVSIVMSALLVGAVAPGTSAVAAGTPPTVNRWSGDDRFETSATISRYAFTAGVPVAFIANGRDFPDALSGAAAAAALGGPVLLTDPAELPVSVEQELDRLDPAKIVVLGGIASVSAGVETRASRYTTGAVERWSGAGRHETSADVSRRTFSPGVPVAFVANARDFPDALAGAAAAGALRGPVLLTERDTLPGVIRDELKRLKPAKVVVLGGEPSVSPSVQTQVGSAAGVAVQRWSGVDRFATAAETSERTFRSGAPVVFIANGRSFPDALSGAAAAAHLGGPVLLTEQGDIGFHSLIEAKRLNPRDIIVLGSDAAVGGVVASQLRAGTAPTEGEGDGRFTIATYPDTQQEVFEWSGDRFLARGDWLAAHKSALDLRFALHTGDVVNWDTDGHEQYVKAKAAFAPLTAAGIPYSLSIGNHDTMATGPGGGARDSKLTRQYQRTTATFNSFWKAADYAAQAGAFEQGKVDNVFSLFRAEGADWLVLTLEMWPRVAAVDWAERVIASHPRANVIIQTHSFLDRTANIEGAGQSLTRWGYGDSSPQYVYDRLVAPYGSVKIVTSGHTGTAASRTVTTARGNTVAFMLQTVHSNYNNPTRLSELDVAAGTISTRVFAPEDGAAQDVTVLRGLQFLTD